MMTLEEKLDMAMRSIKLEEAGQLDEAEELLMAIPLSSSLAKNAKEIFGTDFLRESKLNLSEAEEVYGKDWLK